MGFSILFFTALFFLHRKRSVDIWQRAIVQDFEHSEWLIDTVVTGETKLLLQGSSLDGQEYRDAITQYDGDRHSAHEKAIGDAKLVNRLAAREGLPPIFTGDETQRHQIADFCLELDQYFFQNRRMKLS